MLFNSIEFLIFLVIVLIGYFIIPKKKSWIWLLISSYYFYMSWNPKYALLIFTSTLITFLSGKYLGKFNNIQDSLKRKKLKKWCVAISFASNLSILFFYKYFNFLSHNITELFNKLNVSLDVPNLDILLPVGISFYTFQALSYTMDVYRERIKPEGHFGKYALFVSFFPQLVAGPIERASHLLPQIQRGKDFCYERLRSGLILMGWGLFKKIVIADRLAVLVNTVYNNPREYQGFPLIIATLFFTFQIYCDFSAYSDIAIGVSKIMGYDLMKNFKKPYFSRSIAEFWKRWHISLGTWFKDYLYIPLGGNRVSIKRNYLNILIVFLVSGMWHGASWTFLFWGLLHGIYQVTGRSFMSLRNRFLTFIGLNSRSNILNFYRIAITFTLVFLAWIFFRANSLKDAFYIINNMFVSPFDINSKIIFGLGLDKKEFIVSVISLLILFVIDLLDFNDSLINKLKSIPVFFRWAIYYVFILFIIIFGYYGNEKITEFIYFQF